MTTKRDADQRYGIASVLALLRQLPLDTNPQLVMQVVRRTLESRQVKVDDLVAEARARTGQLEQSISELEVEIASRQAKAVTMRQELAELREAAERLAGNEWDRPSVMRLEDRDLESIPSPQTRGKGPRP